VSRHTPSRPNARLAYWYDDFRDLIPFRADIAIPIDDVIEQKVDMACAHVSQVFEWLPYNAERLNEVPPESDPEGRRTLMANHVRARGEHRRKNVGAALAKWYGGKEALYAEAFQICEYGRVPKRSGTARTVSALKRPLPTPSLRRSGERSTLSHTEYGIVTIPPSPDVFGDFDAEFVARLGLDLLAYHEITPYQA